MAGSPRLHVRALCGSTALPCRAGQLCVKESQNSLDTGRWGRCRFAQYERYVERSLTLSSALPSDEKRPEVWDEAIHCAGSFFFFFFSFLSRCLVIFILLFCVISVVRHDLMNSTGISLPKNNMLRQINSHTIVCSTTWICS